MERGRHKNLSKFEVVEKDLESILEIDTRLIGISFSKNNPKQCIIYNFQIGNSVPTSKLLSFQKEYCISYFVRNCEVLSYNPREMKELPKYFSDIDEVLKVETVNF